ncbi:uncharacterized protein [Triticum aestivum]|uniref:uncharacterized protein n=1 Tax=Triticum aestivum TaxID=4565 RepID=UPI001D0212D3|nr:uncharacterized protein LOC123177173 [Triticum aestivum]
MHRTREEPTCPIPSDPTTPLPDPHLSLLPLLDGVPPPATMSSLLPLHARFQASPPLCRDRNPSPPRAPPPRHLQRLRAPLLPRPRSALLLHWSSSPVRPRRPRPAGHCSAILPPPQRLARPGPPLHTLAAVPSSCCRCYFAGSLRHAKSSPLAFPALCVLPLLRFRTRTRMSPCLCLPLSSGGPCSSRQDPFVVFAKFNQTEGFLPCLDTQDLSEHCKLYDTMTMDSTRMRQVPLRSLGFDKTMCTATPEDPGCTKFLFEHVQLPSRAGHQVPRRPSTCTPYTALKRRVPRRDPERLRKLMH